jgi:hypothetical protein
LTGARLPLAEEREGFDCADIASSAHLVREPGPGGFVAEQRSVVQVGGTGTGMTRLAIAGGG